MALYLRHTVYPQTSIVVECTLYGVSTLGWHFCSMYIFLCSNFYPINNVLGAQQAGGSVWVSFVVGVRAEYNLCRLQVTQGPT